MNRIHTLVVGGTRGIGRALVRLFCSEGHLVSVIGRHQPDSADQVLPGARHWTVDMRDERRLGAALKDIIRRRGKLSRLVFLQRYRGGDGEDAWAGEIELALTATKNIIERLIPHFDESAERAIVIVGSPAGDFIASERDLGYHVAKAGQNQLMRYYAAVLAPYGIRVNGVSPATVLKEESKSFYAKNRRLRDFYRRITPLGRMGTAEDVAETIAFLCGPKAAFITGQNIFVDGGLSLLWQESIVRKHAPPK